jgi:hypothetical protein
MMAGLSAKRADFAAMAGFGIDNRAKLDLVALVFFSNLVSLC